MDESECQSVVNKWAGLYGYDDAPKVVFGTIPMLEEQELGPGEKSSSAWISCYEEGSEIQMDINLWQKQSKLEMLCTLGHEFAHWLQYKQGREFDEQEADEIGMKLAKNEIISKKSQLPLMFP